MQFGQADDVLLQQIANTLLACIDGETTPESTDDHDADSET